MTTREREALIREKLAKAPAMTAAQRLEQRISFAFGNAKIDEPAVTRDMIEAIAKRER